MYSIDEYKRLVNKYASYGSWAIWDYADSYDTSIIGKHYAELNSKYVLLGLNISRLLRKPPWANFHDNTHSRKLKYACNDTLLRGSYMTDIFKDIPEAVSSNLEKQLKQEDIQKHVDFFIQEMKDVQINSDTVFIIFGKTAEKYYLKYFRKYFENKWVGVRHYSDFRMSDEAWVLEFWKSMCIDKDFGEIIRKYKR